MNGNPFSERKKATSELNYFKYVGDFLPEDYKWFSFLTKGISNWEHSVNNNSNVGITKLATKVL